MPRTPSGLLPLLVAAALSPAVACGQNQSTSAPNQATTSGVQPPASDPDVLATVNGTPIREADVSFALSRRGHDPEIPPEHRKNVLEVIIRRELLYQRALELGLDANASYQEALRAMEAQLNAFKRDELAELFSRREITGKAVVSDAEAQKYFEENTARMQTELHVWQILLRKENAIEQTLKDLEQGTSFEEVAGRRFSSLPKTDRAPWDLGYLRWNQVPEPWRNVVYDLKKGEVSGIIRGPNNRFWIIKLLDKRENPDITFEKVKPTIVEMLKTAKTEELREKTDRDLRAKAKIVYLNSAAKPSDEPSED